MANQKKTEPNNELRDPQAVRVTISRGGMNCGLKLLIETAAAKGAKKQPNAADTTNGAGARNEIRLTERERQVLRLIAEGLHNRQIAARIHRSIKTIEKHRQNLNWKLNTHEVAGLTRQALALGLMDKPREGAKCLSKEAKRLTPRELEVLRFVAQGSGNKWIASELRRSIKTVDHHRENIMKKLGIHGVAGLTRHALAIGLL